MAIFLLCLALLVLGYFVYGACLERVFQPDAGRATPAMSMADGVDYVPMPTWKIFLIQLLNIAGLGPVFGPILGALYGPVALLWIVFGCILGGGAHDYLSGMISLRQDGKGLPEIVGDNLGPFFLHLIRVFTVLLMLLVGVVFVLGPAELLASLSGVDKGVWIAAIFCYYFLATILPIDKIIGRLYPLFGAVLMFMAVALPVALVAQGYTLFPHLTLQNLHPKGLPVWPLMFITIACGAISGFHSTQSPMMARCLRNERSGRVAFYGAMLAEGFIALVWAAVGMSFYPGGEALGASLAKGGPAFVVNETCTALLGGFGGVLAILGVVALPITTGDTAFRAARLIVADFLRAPQRRMRNRLFIAVPLFVAGFICSRSNFELLWRYMSWSNQSLAAIVLWAVAVYCARRGRNHWVATVPAVFMTAVTNAYILNAPIGFGLPMDPAIAWGGASAVAALAAFLLSQRKGVNAAASPDNA
jgi:carbon starvation protein CstA